MKAYSIIAQEYSEFSWGLTKSVGRISVIKIGIIGFGFIGRMHYRCWKALEDVEIVAICDVNASALQGSGQGLGNIAGASGAVDLRGIAVYSDPDEMFARVKRFWPLLLLMGLYALCFAPTLSLVNSLSFTHIPNPEVNYFRVRVWGAISWVLAGWALTAWRRSGTDEHCSDRPGCGNGSHSSAGFQKDGIPMDIGDCNSHVDFYVPDLCPVAPAESDHCLHGFAWFGLCFLFKG